VYRTHEPARARLSPRRTTADPDCDLLWSIKGEIAIVTVGSRGIGRYLAIQLASRGADVAISYRSRKTDAENVNKEPSALPRDSLLTDMTRLLKQCRETTML